MRRIAVQEQDFDVNAELACLGGGETGAIASFIGIVRASSGGQALAALRLEHYPGMTERTLERLGETAAARFQLTGYIIIHRVGRLAPGQNIVLVATASAHRANALQATGFLIDQLKTTALFWKAEEFASGATTWVAARAEDETAAAAWLGNLPPPPGRL